MGHLLTKNVPAKYVILYDDDSEHMQNLAAGLCRQHEADLLMARSLEAVLDCVRRLQPIACIISTAHLDNDFISFPELVREQSAETQIFLVDPISGSCEARAKRKSASAGDSDSQIG